MFFAQKHNTDKTSEKVESGLFTAVLVIHRHIVLVTLITWQCADPDQTVQALHSARIYLSICSTFQTVL